MSLVVCTHFSGAGTKVCTSVTELRITLELFKNPSKQLPSHETSLERFREYGEKLMSMPSLGECDVESEIDVDRKMITKTIQCSG